MKVGVIGAGTMGSGIAQAFAQCDKVDTVYLCDIKQEKFILRHTRCNLGR